MKYEIINPSDACTIEHESFLAMAVACIILGNGQYALEPIGHDGPEVPFFMFGGFEDWWEKHSPTATFERWLDDNGKKLLVAEALESVTLTNGESSSLNDIAGRAKRWAASLRKGVASGPSAPQQVFGQ